MKGKYLVFIDKHRTTIALFVILPLIFALFWVMYVMAMDPGKKSSLKRTENEPRLVVPEAPTEMRTKTKPDVTVVLGLKKATPQTKPQPAMIINTGEDGKQGEAKGKDRREAPQEKQERPDPYPDAQ